MWGLVVLALIGVQDPAGLAGIRDQVLRRGAPGAVVAVVREGGLSVHALGHADAARTDSMRVSGLFGTGKVADLLTALACVLLDERGDIALDAPISTYAPDLPRRIGEVTLAQLLSHTAGLDDAANDESAPRRRVVSTVWPDATDRALFTEPGAIHSPSRHGMPLVRAILEKVTGSSFTGLVDELVFRPAGLLRTTFDPQLAVELGAVDGHVLTNTREGPVRVIPPPQNPLPQPYSTAQDLARLLELLVNGGTVWAGDVVDAMRRSRAPLPAAPGDSIAFAGHVTRLGGWRQLVFESRIAGYGSLLRMVPDAHAALVVLSNATGALPTSAADSLLAALVGAPAERSLSTPQRRELPADPDAWAGTYLNGDRFAQLEVHDGALHWRNGDILLPAPRTGARLDVTLDDGRIVQVLHLFLDDAGRAYVIVDGIAYSRQ